VLWIYRDLWHQRGVPTGFGWDVIDTHGPDLDYVSRELREGRFSLWNPWDKGGYPVYADPVVDRYYPFNGPFVAWGALAGTSWWLVQIKVLAHHVALAACMHLFLRSRGLPVRAAITGGIGLVASAPLLIHKGSNILWPLVWVPLVWLAIDAALARPTWRRGAGLGAAFLLCATAGSPPGLFYALLLILPYGLWRLATERVPLRQLAIPALAASVVTGLVLLVTVTPTGELVALAARQRWGGGGFALQLSLPFRAAARGVISPVAGLPEMYVGCAIALCAACAVVVRPRFDRGIACVLCGVAAFGVVLAAGATTGVLPWLVEHVPGFGLLRIPGRYKLVSAWALAAAAGYGVAALDEPGARRRAIACAGAMFVVVTVLALGWVRADLSLKDRPAWHSIALAALAAGVVIAAVTTRRRAACLALLAPLALWDAPWFIHPPARPPASDPRRLHERDAAILARLEGIRDRFRIYDEYVLGERAGQRLGVRDFRGYPAIDPLCQARYVDVLDYVKRDAAILADFNVRYLLKAPHFRFVETASMVRGVPPGFEARGDGIYEARHPAPLAVWYGAISVVPKQADVLPAMRAAALPDGGRRHAVLEPADAARLGDAAARLAPASAASAASVEARLVHYEPDEIELEVDAPREGLVVLNELVYPGWRVAIDGAEATPLRANYLLRAVHVPAGRHRIAWTFEPRGIGAKQGGYLLALVIVLAAAVWPRRPRPQPSLTTSQSPSTSRA
jgi:hypothetical protein